MPLKVKGTPIETKPVAGLGTNAIIGYFIGLAFAVSPTLRDKIPLDYQLQLPIVVGTIVGGIAAYYAKHTSRPDLGSGLVLPFSDEEIEQIKYLAAQQGRNGT